MTLEENLQLLSSTKKSIKESLNNKVANSTDNIPFSEYYSIIDGIKVEDVYTITSNFKLSEFSGSFFTNINGYIDSVVIPSVVTKLGDYAFRGANIKEINIPESVTTLGKECFNACGSIENISIPSGITSLPEYCFNQCEVLKNVSMHDNITTLGNHCFDSCKTMPNIVLPKNLTTLGDYCFYRCYVLKEIIIPESVISIGQYCFCDNHILEKVICYPKTPPEIKGNVFSHNPLDQIIYVPAESVDAYKNATNWSSYADNIQAIPS